MMWVYCLTTVTLWLGILFVGVNAMVELDTEIARPTLHKIECKRRCK
jgi:hypothetical protein